MKLYYVHFGFDGRCDDNLYYGGMDSIAFASREAALVHLADSIEADARGEFIDWTCNALDLSKCYIWTKDVCDDVPSKERLDEALTKLPKRLVINEFFNGTI